MTKYLIEFRFLGKAKGEIKSLIWEVNKRFHIRPRYRPVPHVSLVGPFTTRDERRLVNTFKRICKNQNIMQFDVTGFNTFDENRVVFIDIKPDKKMDEFRWELSKNLHSFCNLKSYDYKREFKYHSTIAMKLHPRKFFQVKKYINTKSKPKFRNVLLRVALIKNRKILQEYDFLLKKTLSRREAKSREILSKTFNELKKYLNIIEHIPEINLDALDFFSKLKNILRKRNIFLISDTHFDHANIIKYCNRPFKSASVMNKIMLNNWNRTVNKRDIVFFLGDMRCGRNSRETDYWLKRLNGKIYFLDNTHDTKSRITKYYDKLIVKYQDKKFLLVHDPKDVPKDWKGWTICGHHHNNYPKDFPLINGKTKMINVGVELINYTPLNIEKLFELNYENIKFMGSIESKPITKNNMGQ